MGRAKYKEASRGLMDVSREKRIELMKAEKDRIQEMIQESKESLRVTDLIPESDHMREWMSQFYEKALNHKGELFPESTNYAAGECVYILVVVANFSCLCAFRSRTRPDSGRAKKVPDPGIVEEGSRGEEAKGRDSQDGGALA